uniref:Copper transport protein n=1 Tax=Euplotes crassus TaxID=5936 RepID=A0A7S3NXW0_EUPCR|mmetsp:Transcript_31555/g.31034  ORF Transcript_31555/g.31034 Transcript_31555/m.31034 type:complete len:167 (+) Transcript_31555:40-540(+)
MFFYQSTEVVFLFKDWKIHSTGPYIGALFATFVIGILLEFVTFAIGELKAHNTRSGLKAVTKISDNHQEINQSRGIYDNSISEHSFKEEIEYEENPQLNIGMRCIIAVGYFFQLVLAYLVMMIAMTYNFFLFLAPVGGMMIGYLLLGFIAPLFQQNGRDQEYAQIK